MAHIKKSYALITGASSGIGREFAYALAKEGYPLIITARRRDRLKELADDIDKYREMAGISTSDIPKTKIITADLSKKAAISRLIKQVDDLKVGVFINNAGFGDAGAFIESDLEKELTMIDVNIKALHALTKYMLRKMKKQGGGYILNVASSAGLLAAGPYMATYYATKSYVVSLTTAISRELAESKSSVYIGALCPGPVDTEFNDVAEVEFALAGISAKECVSSAIKGMKQRKIIIVPERSIRIAVAAARLLPPQISAIFTAHQQKKKLG